MRTLLKAVLGAGIVAAVGAISVGPSAAQYYHRGPHVGIYVGPTYHHRHHRRYYAPRRHYGYYHHRRGYNGCRYGFTVQDGVCKPYRGY